MAKKSTKDLQNHILVSLPLSEFKKKYIPILFDGTPGEFSSEWTKLAGNPYVQVKLVDGDKEYIVPPLCGHFGMADGFSAVAIASTGSQLHNRAAGTGEKFLSKHLPELLPFNSRSNIEIQNQNALAWRQLLKDIGINNVPGEKDDELKGVDGTDDDEFTTPITFDDDGEW